MDVSEAIPAPRLSIVWLARLDPQPAIRGRTPRTSAMCLRGSWRHRNVEPEVRHQRRFASFAIIRAILARPAALITNFSASRLSSSQVSAL